MDNEIKIQWTQLTIEKETIFDSVITIICALKCIFDYNCKHYSFNGQFTRAYSKHS